MIFKIAKAELRNLFYSPIAWLIIIVFYVLCGYQFVNPLVDYARIQEANLENNPNFLFTKAISISIFVKSIHNVLENLYLFIPLLTMGIINREATSGSLKLLYSSPIRTRDIVLGKYLGLMIFNLVLVFIVALLFATAFFTIVDVELKWYLSIVLGLFLLVNAYVAIGIFMSSLTNYQLVAAILTFIVLFLLRFLSGVWQQYDFFRDLTYFLSMTNKAEIMINGLITTRDLFYFILITTLFLGFTIIKLKSTQESKSWKVPFYRYSGLFIVVMIIGYFTSKSGFVGYLDVTKNKTNTIHSNVQQVLKKLDGSPLTVTLYTNLMGRAVQMGLPQARNNYIWDYWEMYLRYYPNIHLKYVYYYDVQEKNKKFLSHFQGKTIHQMAPLIADLLKVDVTDFKKPNEVRSMVDLSQEDDGLILEFEYKGRKALARTYNDDLVVPDQSNISATLLRLIDNSAPRVVFTTGHFERSPNSLGERGYATLFNNKLAREGLINNGVDTDTIALSEKDIPANTTVLVVADPKTVYSEIEKEKMLSYLRQGGNAFILGEPGKQAILNELLFETGVKFDDGVIVQPKKNYTPDFIHLILTHLGHQMSDQRLMYSYKTQGSIAGMGASTVANLSYVEKNGFKVDPVYDFTSRTESWLENGLYVADSAAPVFSAAEGDVKKDRYIVGLQLTRKINGKEQRIVIGGEADNISNREFAGIDVANGMMSWLMYNKVPVYVNFPPPTDRKVTISFDGARILYVSYVYIIPSVLFLTGLILLIRRKRK